MGEIARENTVKTFNSRIAINTPIRAALQCTKEEYKQSGSGNMMIAREWQIIQHAPAKIDGAEIDITGQELREYTVLKVSDGKDGFLPDDNIKVKKAVGQAYTKLDFFGYGPDEVINTDNPKLEMTGKVIDAMINTKEQPMNHAPTAEQLAKGQKQGDAMLDENGKPKMRNQLNIMTFCGVSAVEAQQF